MEQQVPKEDLLYTSEDLVIITKDIRKKFAALNDKQILDGVVLLLMVANDNELDAAMCYLTKSKVQVLHSQGNIYHVGKWGEIPAALIKQSEQGTSGPNGSQNLTRLSISVFKNLKVIIGLGICGTKGRLGDVIVSSRIDECKFKVGAKQLIDRGNKFPPGDNITKFLQYNNRIWSFQCTRPGVEVYESKVVFQPMLSGTPLIASGQYRDQLIQDVSQESGGVEMEGIGIINGLRAAEKFGQVEFIIVKAGCDYADESKNKEWQPVAAMAAADFVYNQLSVKFVQDWFNDNAGHLPSPVSKPPPGGKGDDEEHSKEIKRNITTNFSKLTKSFPIDGLLADLYSKMVIDDGQKEAIQKKDLRKEKVSYLFSEVITPELDSGIHTKYDNLIKVMEDSDDTTAHHLARVLKDGSKSAPDH